jgi:hypothetical protein
VVSHAGVGQCLTAECDIPYLSSRPRCATANSAESRQQARDPPLFDLEQEEAEAILAGYAGQTGLAQRFVSLLAHGLRLTRSTFLP